MVRGPASLPKVDIHTHLSELVERLPQAGVIDSARRERWISKAIEVTKGDVATCEYLVSRLGGFTASDMSALMLDGKGEFQQSRTARDVVAEKLMVHLPTGTSADASREMRAKGTARDLFYGLIHGMTPISGASDAIARTAHPDFPWMLGSPVELANLGGKVVLAQMKVPRAEVAATYRDEGLPYEFTLQAHHHALLASVIGYPPARLVCAVMDVAAWEAQPYIIDRDPAIERELIAVGEQTWSAFVMKGVLPPEHEVKIFDPAKVPPAVQSLLEDITRLTVIEKEAGEVAGDKRLLLLGEIRKLGHLNGQRLQDANGVVHVTAAGETWNTDRMAQLLTALGVDLEPLKTSPGIDEEAVVRKLQDAGRKAQDFLRDPMKDATKALNLIHEIADTMRNPPAKPAVLDPEKMAEALRDKNEDPARFRTEQLRVGLTRTRKGPAAELLTELRTQASAQVARIASLIGETTPQERPVAKASRSP